MSTEKKLTIFQNAIIDFCDNSDRNLIVQAFAGTGKTFILCKNIEVNVRKFPYASIFAGAFNTKIEEELKTRVDQRVTVLTLHKLGLRALFSKFGKIAIDKDNDKENAIAINLLSSLGDEKETFALRMQIIKTVTLAKSYLAETSEEFEEVIERHQIDLEECNIDQFIEYARAVLVKSREDTKRITFSDMIYYVWYHKIKLPAHLKFDFMHIDEAQDLNPAQHYLVMQALKSGGRCFVYGDRNQAIYLFTGADSLSMDKMKDAFNAVELPLPTTWRCPKKVVALAQELVPGIEASPDAKEGIVETINYAKMMTMASPGDFILSRTNAPLIGIVMKLIALGKPANVQGRDVSEGLLALVKKSKAKKVDTFITYLCKWRDKEIERLSNRNKDFTHITDKAECLLTLCDGLDTIKELNDVIYKIFVAEDEMDPTSKSSRKKDPMKFIIASTVHKVKGLERKRVFMLQGTFSRKTQENRNIEYVAITRAQEELYLVVKDK